MFKIITSRQILQADFSKRLFLAYFICGIINRIVVFLIEVELDLALLCNSDRVFNGFGIIFEKLNLSAEISTA